jgi:lipopolysaccharide/colanic/teichoic acid biosynthesis glycosyltransferase
LKKQQFISTITPVFVAFFLLSIAFPLKLNTTFIYGLGLLALFSFFILAKKTIQLPIFFFISTLFVATHALHYWLNPSNELLNFELEKKTPFLLIPLFFSVIDVKTTMPKIMKIVAFGACYIALSLLIFAGYKYFQTSDKEVFYYHNLVSVVNGNAIYYSLFFSSALLFAFELLIKEKQRVYLFPIGLLTIVILLLSSKIFTLMLVIIFLYYSLIHVKSISFKASLIVLFIIGFVFSFQKISARFNEIDRSQLLESQHTINPATVFDGFSLRKELILLGLELKAEHSSQMFVGLGPGICQEKLNQKFIDKQFYLGENAQDKSGFYNYNFHNQYLQTFLETGWIGLFSILLLLITPFIIVETDSKRIVFLLNGLFIIGFLTESFLSRQMGIVSYVSINSIFIAQQSRTTRLMLKRIFDFVFSLSVIVFVLSWLVPLLCLFIIIDLKSSPFFVQKRVGRNGKVFHCFKLRSMKKNALQHQIPAQIDDTRITNFGAFLRKYALDELPQFFNVLLGEMSVVGPRPLMLSDEEKFNELIPNFSSRLVMKPGITGFAQAFGYKGYVGSRVDIANRYRLDKKYSQIQSLWLDIKLIFFTIKTVIYAK